MTSRFRLAGAAIAVGVALGACYGSSSGLTAAGHGRPELTIDFPETAPAGSIQTLDVHVANPGPGDIDSLFVAFTAVGVPGSGMGAALVEPSRGSSNPAIVQVRPKPQDVSDDGVVYRFPGLAVGESTTIGFSIKVPRAVGPASNSLQVYDGSEPDRAVGVRVATTVRG